MKKEDEKRAKFILDYVKNRFSKFEAEWGREDVEDFGAKIVAHVWNKIHFAPESETEFQKWLSSIVRMQAVALAHKRKFEKEKNESIFEK